MKSKFGTALALTAVILTGTAAAAINTQALNSPTEPKLDTAATTSLPEEQNVSVVPLTNPAASVSPIQASASGQIPTQPSATLDTKKKSTPVPSNSNGDTSSQAAGGLIASETIAVNPPSTNPPVTTSPSPKPTLYGNPNPSNGNEDDDEEDDDEEDDDEEDDD